MKGSFNYAACAVLLSQREHKKGKGNGEVGCAVVALWKLSMLKSVEEHAPVKDYQCAKSTSCCSNLRAKRTASVVVMSRQRLSLSIGIIEEHATVEQYQDAATGQRKMVEADKTSHAATA